MMMMSQESGVRESDGHKYTWLRVEKKEEKYC